MTGYIHTIGFNSYFTVIISVYSMQHRRRLLGRPVAIDEVYLNFKETITIHHFGKRILDELAACKTN